MIGTPHAIIRGMTEFLIVCSTFLVAVGIICLMIGPIIEGFSDLSIERQSGCLYLKVNGITRFIYFPRGPKRITTAYVQRGMLFVSLFGFGAVFAPRKAAKS